MKYRKKPIEVQVTNEWFDGDHPNPLHPVGLRIDPCDRSVAVVTWDGEVRAYVGDYIVTDFTVGS